MDSKLCELENDLRRVERERAILKKALSDFLLIHLVTRQLIYSEDDHKA